MCKAVGWFFALLPAVIKHNATRVCFSLFLLLSCTTKTNLYSQLSSLCNFDYFLISFSLSCGFQPFEHFHYESFGENADRQKSHNIKFSFDSFCFLFYFSESTTGMSTSRADAIPESRTVRRGITIRTDSKRTFVVASYELGSGLITSEQMFHWRNSARRAVF